MHPQLAKTYGPKFSRFPCFVQPKLNGVRALYNSGVFQSRGQQIWQPKVLAHLTDLLNHIIPPELILDGELYHHGWKLQRINSAVAVKTDEPTEDTPQISYHVFDCICRRCGYDQPFSKRYLDIYNSLLDLGSPLIIPVPTALIHFQEEVDLHFHQYVAAGYEGIMLRPDGPYVPGMHLSERTGSETQKRSDFLWKYKSWQDEEFMCVGIVPGQGKASIGIGALVCQTKTYPEYTPQYPRLKTSQFEVGTGFDDDERVALLQNPPIGKMIKVRFNDYTADGIPTPASFLCVMP